MPPDAEQASPGPQPLTPADRIAVGTGVLARLVVLAAAVVLCIEAVLIFRGGYDGFQDHLAGRTAAQQAMIAAVPFGVMVLVPRWARILLSVSRAAWISPAVTGVTVAAIVGSLAALPVVALSIPAISSALGEGVQGSLGQGVALGLLLWTLFAPFTHMIGVEPHYPRRAQSRALVAVQAMLRGELYRGPSILALVMIGFWVVVTGTRDDEPYETGIVEAGADPWMTGLLIAQLLLLRVLRVLTRHDGDRTGPFLLGFMVAISVGFLALFDGIASGRIGFFHAVAALPVLLAVPSLVREFRRSSD